MTENVIDISAEPNQRRLRVRKYLPLIAMLAIAGFLFYYVDAEHSLTGRPTMDMLIGLAVINFGFYVWTRALSGWQPRSQFKLVGIVVVVQALIITTVQMEGIYGNGRPIFAWRWKPHPADEFTQRFDRPAEAEFTEIELPELAEWPQFRGPNRDGIASTRTSNWQMYPPRELWRQPIGAGWSSFAVMGDYFFTMEQRGDAECVTCYELVTGKQIWIHADAERFSEITGGEGPRSTPCISEGFLYTLGATGILNCLDARNGKLVWTVDVLKSHEALNCYYGMCASPLVVGEKVMVNPGGPNASLVAYHKKNGSLVWQGGDAEASYSSPQHMKLRGVDQVLNFNADGLFSHSLETGAILWSIPWISNEAERNNVCQPIRIPFKWRNRVFISSGYGQGAALFDIIRDAEKFDTEMVWSNKKLRSKFASAVFDGRYIFGLDEGILVCLDAATGKRMWKQGRYNHGQLLLAGEYLLVQSEDGYIAQVAAVSDSFAEIARIEALDRRTWTHPVLAGNYLLTRNDREMVCYELKTRE